MMASWYQRNKERFTARQRKWNEANKERRIQRGIIYRATIKTKVLTHYGNGILACVKCGFNDIRALSLDHINGGGSKERRSLTFHTYKYLIDNNYPQGYQTLCMNCQWIKRVENHEMFNWHLAKGETIP